MKIFHTQRGRTGDGKRVVKALVWWLMAVCYMGLIFYFSSQSRLPFAPITQNFDKAVHMAAYVPLAFLVYRAMVHSGLRKYAFIAAVAVACLYGISDEFHQSTVPGRDAAVGDFLADSVGAFLGSLAGSRTVSRSGTLRGSAQ